MSVQGWVEFGGGSSSLSCGLDALTQHAFIFCRSPPHVFVSSVAASGRNMPKETMLENPKCYEVGAREQLS